MKRKQQLNFKTWVEKHDPQSKWNWNNPSEIQGQLCDVIRDCGNLELKDIFEMMFILGDTGLTTKQNKKFLKEKY